MMTERDLNLLLLNRLLSKEKKSTTKLLVEFYDNDLDKIKDWKDKMGVSWKDFFRVIVFMSEMFVDDKQLNKLVMGKIGGKD